MSWRISSREFSEYAVTITFNKPDHEKRFLDGSLMSMVLYSAVIAIFLMVLALIVKLLWNCEGEEQSGSTENRLLSWEDEVVFSTYGTSEEDLESADKVSFSSSSEDLYDEKICAICYDDQRSCLFIPCGHCITCITCAKRIINEEKTKTCPMCRTLIHKVRKLQIL